MRLLRPWMQNSDPDRPCAWANWPPAALGRGGRARAGPEALSPLAICLRHGREHTELTGWEALCRGCESHAGWRSAAGVAKRTGGLAPRGLCPIICALLPPSGSSSHERSPLTDGCPEDSDPFGLPDIGPSPPGWSVAAGTCSTLVSSPGAT